MGRLKRGRPKHLPRKLLLIRQRLGLSQTEMAKVLKLKVHYSAVSNYEKGSREPDLLILLRYARLTGAPMENLVDDSFDLWLGAGIPKDAIIELPPPRPTKKRPKP